MINFSFSLTYGFDMGYFAFFTTMDPFSTQDKFTLSDDALIELMKLDQEWALKEIFRRYNAKLHRQATGVLNDSDAAKDLVQDVFVDLWKRRRSSGIKLLPRYLSRAIKFQVLRHLRDGRLEEHHLKLMHDIQFVSRTEEIIDHEELHNLLRGAVNELSPRCREVFLLSRFENLSHREISTRLNISTKTVEAQISKALSTLRQKLQHIITALLLIDIL